MKELGSRRDSRLILCHVLVHTPLSLGLHSAEVMRTICKCRNMYIMRSFLQIEKEQLSPANTIMYWLNNEIVVGSLSTVLAPYAAILSESRSGSFSTGCVSIIVSCITAINYSHTVRHAILSNLMISIVYNIFSL